MTTYTEQQMVAIGGNLWTRAGKRRVYLNDWAQWVGLELDHYKSGNIRSASLDGADLSNRRAGLLTSARVFWEDGRIHTDLHRVADGARLPVPGAELVERLRTGIAHAVAEAAA